MPPAEKQKQLHALAPPVLPASSNGAVTRERERPQARTIQDVPIELLLEIFRIHAAHSQDTSSPTDWMGILLVCSYWHRVACEASELWRVIHVGSNIDWLRLCLRRSARSLVDLHFSGLPAATVEVALPLCTPHAQRIRAVHLTGHGCLSPDMCTFLRQPLPALEELSILPAEWRASREAALIPWEQGYTGLRALALSGVSIPRDPAFYRNMRALELHERCCSESKFTIDDLVRALAAAAATLEELDLSRFEPIIPEDPGKQSDPRELPTVRFRRLRGFYMDDDSRVVSRLTKYLTLTRGAFLHLRVFLSFGDQQRYTNGTAMLADLVPPGVRHVLDSLAEMIIVISRESYSIRAPNSSANAPSSSHGPQAQETDGPLTDRVVLDTLGWAPNLRPGLRGILTVHTAGLLTSLSITLGGSEYPVAEWRTLFGALRLLEKLAIVDHAHLNPMDAFVALSAAPSEPGPRRAGEGGSDALPSGPGSPEHVLCPSLRTLSLEGLVQGYEVDLLLKELRRALRSRAALGLRLAELRVECSRMSDVVAARLEAEASTLVTLADSLLYSRPRRDSCGYSGADT